MLRRSGIYWFCVSVMALGVFVLGLDVGHVAAQIADPDGAVVPNFWMQMFEMAKAAGALGAISFAYIAYRVDKERLRVDAERIKYRDMYDALVQIVLPLVQQGLVAQEKLSDLLQPTARRR